VIPKANRHEWSAEVGDAFIRFRASAPVFRTPDVHRSTTSGKIVPRGLRGSDLQRSLVCAPGTVLWFELPPGCLLQGDIKFCDRFKGSGAKHHGIFTWALTREVLSVVPGVRCYCRTHQEPVVENGAPAHLSSESMIKTGLRILAASDAFVREHPRTEKQKKKQKKQKQLPAVTTPSTPVEGKGVAAEEEDEEEEEPDAASHDTDHRRRNRSRSGSCSRNRSKKLKTSQESFSPLPPSPAPVDPYVPPSPLRSPAAFTPSTLFALPLTPRPPVLMPPPSSSTPVSSTYPFSPSPLVPSTPGGSYPPPTPRPPLPPLTPRKTNLPLPTFVLTAPIKPPSTPRTPTASSWPRVTPPTPGFDALGLPPLPSTPLPTPTISALGDSPAVDGQDDVVFGWNRFPGADPYSMM
jgi:hypothetical protein